MDAISTYTGGTAILKIYDLTAGAPANCEAAITGTILATVTCPASYFAAAGGGTITKNGTWSDTSADAAGTADFFRLFKNDGTTCVMQGVVGAGQDMTMDNYVIAATQLVTINSFTLVAGNA